MSKKLKLPKKQSKLSLQKIQERACNNASGRLLLTFSHVTTNSSYNFDYFGRNRSDELNARRGLDALIAQISDIEWKHLMNRSKFQLGGFETLRLSDLNISGVGLPADTTIFVFRFYRNQYRMCGYKDVTGCHALHVLAYDFDHSLYDHG